jgi:SAM-dependent methyltransferase
MSDPFAINLRTWNERVAIHRRDVTGFYGIEAFLAGGDSLTAIEAAEIGDVAGKRIAHLQCHFGLDTLSLARRGATVVGLDFSPNAIAEARRLARQTGLPATFVEANVHDARAVLEGQFDMVYVTWGAINWLPDIARWAGIVGSLLKPGGHLYLLEGHPNTLCLEWQDGRIVPHYPWRTPRDEPIVSDVATTYNGDPTPLKNPETREWMHPLSDIIAGLRSAGLSLDWLHEHAALAWPLFPNMTKGADGLYRLPLDFPELALSFSLKAAR